MAGGLIVMSDGDAVREGRARRISPLIRGLLLLFDRREGPSYSASAGLRLLAIVVVLELVIGPRAHILELFDLPQPQAWLRIGTLLLEALVAVRLWADVRLGEVGFLSPGKWTATELIFFAQILIVGTLAIPFRGFTLPLSSAGEPVWIAAAMLFGPQILWGFYQELIYRGLLQTELTRRWGGVAGALIANLAFTFGPLHFYHLMRMRPETMNATITVMVATFVMGLLFAFVFHRTRNIWLVGLMHGVGNAVMNTTTGASP
jgi:membrane protease YdiL (CAAX protease family)